MRLLARRAADAFCKGDEAAAAESLQASQRFLGDHLLAWAPSLCRALEVSAPESVYAKAACVLERFMKVDRDVLDARSRTQWPCRSRDLSMQKRPNTTGRKRGCGEADRGVVGGGAFRGDVPQGDQARARRVRRSGHRAGRRCIRTGQGVWLGLSGCGNRSCSCRQKNILAFSLFVIVMFQGVLSDGAWLKRALLPIRGELSIIACILSLGHVTVFGTAYLERMAFARDLLSPFGVLAVAAAVCVVALMVPLFVTSFKVVRSRMAARSWKSCRRSRTRSSCCCSCIWPCSWGRLRCKAGGIPGSRWRRTASFFLPM